MKKGNSSGGPLFHIEAEDIPNNPVIATTATGAWTTVVKQVNKINNRIHSNSASGPDYYGFSHPTIAKMIQDLPNSGKCVNYVPQHFVVMKDRHVRGVIKKGRGGKPSESMIKRGKKALDIAAAAASAKFTKSVMEISKSKLEETCDESENLVTEDRFLEYNDGFEINEEYAEPTDLAPKEVTFEFPKLAPKQEGTVEFPKLVPKND
ncbi:Transforming growth factor beta regulator 1 [Smittium culicis]|uniref:Transforming growth factor beta regulator 1 n=1 Tax=Smittium culicis TaxID=133412 RepID=A0A1R1XQY4_9FUNG|nr:Transforming growth factor beta regulator 1 [Smittium culicis]OMJ16999.1 Transforming growth factor beta regulator 1 [Smittium culicis]